MKELLRGDASLIVSAQIALEAQGIDVLVTDSMLMPGPGRISVVHDEDYDDAQAIVKALQDTPRSSWLIDDDDESSLNAEQQKRHDQLVRRVGNARWIQGLGTIVTVFGVYPFFRYLTRESFPTWIPGGVATSFVMIVAGVSLGLLGWRVVQRRRGQLLTEFPKSTAVK